MNQKDIDGAYRMACDRYAELGVSTDAAIKKILQIPISLHCWQGDDLRGFEGSAADADGPGRGAYPGRARTPQELRDDIGFVFFSLVPGRHRVNLHACYAEFEPGGRVDRDCLEPGHFRNWIEWAKRRGLGLDFNPTFFAHPEAESGFTLTSPDRKTRNFWIRHAAASRRIAAAIGRKLGSPCVCNIRVPDGFRDEPADRVKPRALLKRSLDRCFAEKFDPAEMLDAVEFRPSGAGAECCTVGSHEFYMGYAVKNKILLTLGSGRFHPTETISDKLSACLPFLPGLLLHISRRMRRDGGHVPVLNDDLIAIARELARLDAFDRIRIGLDYFGAGINRIAAWAVGMRAMQKALLLALLDPIRLMADAEKRENYAARMIWSEAAKSLPFGAVWDKLCADEDVPADTFLMREVKTHEERVLSKR